MRDTQAGTTVLATIGNTYSDPCNTDGCGSVDAPINDDVLHPPLLSPLSGPDEAKYLVFDSDASNLVPNDDNDATDVFVSTVGPIVADRISQVPGTTPIDGSGDLNGNSYLLDVTPDLGCNSASPSCANEILLASNASNFSDADSDGNSECEFDCETQDVFSYDFADGPDGWSDAGDGGQRRVAGD